MYHGIQWGQIYNLQVKINGILDFRRKQWYLEEGKSQTSQVLKENSDISDFTCYQINQFVQTQVYLTFFNQCYLANVMVLLLKLLWVLYLFSQQYCLKRIWDNLKLWWWYLPDLDVYSTDSIQYFIFTLTCIVSLLWTQ